MSRSLSSQVSSLSLLSFDSSEQRFEVTSTKALQEEAVDAYCQCQCLLSMSVLIVNVSAYSPCQCLLQRQTTIQVNRSPGGCVAG